MRDLERIGVLVLHAKPQQQALAGPFAIQRAVVGDKRAAHLHRAETVRNRNIAGGRDVVEVGGGWCGSHAGILSTDAGTAVTQFAARLGTMRPMLYYALKVFISALLIVGISEIAKRSSGLAALLAALPLTSLLAFVWLHLEATPPRDIADLSIQIFWLVIPSLLLFLLLPLMLRHGWNFWLSLALSMLATAGFYLTLLPLLRRMGVQL